MKNDIIALLARLFDRDEAELKDEVRINEDLDAESLQKFMLMAELEEKSGKTVTYEDVDACRTVGELIAYAESLM